MKYHQFTDDMHLFIVVRSKTIQSELSVVDTCTCQTVVRYKWTSAERRQVWSHVGTSAQLKSTLSVNVVTVAGSSLTITTEIWYDMISSHKFNEIWNKICTNENMRWEIKSMSEDILSACKSDQNGGLFSHTIQTIIGRKADEMKWRSDSDNDSEVKMRR